MRGLAVAPLARYCLPAGTQRAVPDAAPGVMSELCYFVVAAGRGVLSQFHGLVLLHPFRIQIRTESGTRRHLDLPVDDLQWGRLAFVPNIGLE